MSIALPPVPIGEMTAEQRTAIGNWTHLDFSRVIVNSPRLYRSFVPHLEELIARTSLPARDRQIVCLRILHLCGDVYEKTHHIVISRRSGLDDDAIAAIIEGHGEALTAWDRIVIDASDELYRDQEIADATGAKLAARYSREQLLDLVLLAGCYVTMAMLTKSFAILLEPDLEEFNKLRSYA